MTNKTEGELALQFIDENGLAMKFLLWQEHFLEPQVFSGDVDVEAEDIEVIEIKPTGISGKSANYGIMD